VNSRTNDNLLPPELAWSVHLPDGVTVDALTADGSLPDRWARLWKEAPEAIAVTMPNADGPSTLTRGDLAARSAAAAAALTARGLKRGDRVLFSAPPSLAYLLLYVAALRLGAVVVPANTAYTRPELHYIARDADVTMAVVDEPARMADIEVATFEPRALHDASPSVDQLQLGALDPSALAMIAYTSGTTGKPKGAMLSHRNLLAGAMAVVLAWRWTPDDGLVVALPLFHLHGLGVSVNGGLAAGGRLLVLERFDVKDVAALAAADAATMFFGVPTMYARLVATASEDAGVRDALSSLRLMVSGSAPLSATLWQRLRSLTGQAVLERYGMTETVMLVSNPYDGERRPGSVGVPLPGVEVRLDRTGEILVKGPSVFAGYWRDNAATEAAFTDDGFFRTGDIGEWGDGGYLSIVGRAKELIISGGYNVYPREVEEALESRPDVRAAGVFGVPSDEWGEEIAAAIVPVDRARPPTLAALQRHCEGILASYKRPRHMAIVEELPRNAMGKIARTELPALLSS
jgi:malonyl-CoA/methylmalonyl-CoA synthetase